MKINMLLLLLGFSFFSLAQTESKKVKAYKVIVITENDRIEGFLHSADTSFVYVLENIKNDTSKLLTIKNNDIKRIKIGRKGRVVRGAIIGMALGGGIGFFTAKSNARDGDFFSSDEEGAMGAISLGLIGGGIGALIGTGKKVVDIDYSVENYLNSVNIIRDYSMVKIDL